MNTHSVTLIPGDGIGPEVVDATKKIIEATGVQINWEVCEAGAVVFQKGLKTGVPQETIDSLLRTRVALKGPLATPVGYGEKSANVTLRKLFETYGNIRPVREMPGVVTPYTGRNIDLVIVRENVEDLYAGVEYMPTPTMAHALKIISRKGCEKIVRLGFEVARSGGYKTVHCATKANILKLSEGMLKRVFEEIAPEYPDIQSDHIIVDNCAHQLVKKPEQFQVLIMTNMNGDILSDLSSALVGGLGFAGSANIGNDVAIFEAVHGSAPKYAGKNVINPTAVLMSGVMMLRYLKEFEAASLIENALSLTISKDKILTRDIPNVGPVPATTTEFRDAIIGNLGKKCDLWVERPSKPLVVPKTVFPVSSAVQKEVGMDLFIRTNEGPEIFGPKLEKIIASSGAPLMLKMISCRGVKVYPSIGILPDMVDQYRCRIICKDPAATLARTDIEALLEKVSDQYQWGGLQKLITIDGVDGYTKAQGED